MRNRSMIVAGALIVATAAAWLLFGGSSAKESAESSVAERAPPAVTVIAAARREIAEEVNVSGTLVAREEVLVSPEIDGLAVTQIMVEEGDSVEKGEVLARLSRQTIETQIAQAEASIAQARAQIAEAEAALGEQKQALARAENLRKSGTVSEQVHEQRLAAAKVAEARQEAARQQLAVAQAQRRELDLKLGYTEIRAPTAGIVSRRTLRIGAIANMAAEPSFRIIEDGDVELEADIADVNLARLETGQKARVFPAGMKEAVEGRVRLISPRIDPATRLGRVRLEIANGTRVSIGAFASAVVEIGRRESVVLPLQAVTVNDGAASVQRVIDGRVETRPVKLGLRAQREVEVTEGLAEGDVVVARAGSFLRDGDRVTPHNGETAAADAEARR